MKKVHDLPMDGSASRLDGAFRGVIEEAAAPLTGRMENGIVDIAALLKYDKRAA